MFTVLGFCDGPNFIAYLQQNEQPLDFGRDKNKTKGTRKMKRNFWLMVVLLFSFQLLTAGSKKPAWVENRPVSKFYYIGIGSVSKTDNPKDYRKVAKDEALQDLSSEIQVSISGEFMHKVAEQGGILEDDIKSLVQSKTKANLQGYELVDNWEDAAQYWVYYRLSKEVYEKQKRSREDKAASLGRDLFIKAKQSEQNYNITSALRYYIQALTAIEEFLGQPLQIDYQGQKLYLQNTIYASMQSDLSCLSLTAVNPKLSGKSGRALSKPLKLRVTCRKGGKAFPVDNLPLHFFFIKGEGKLISDVLSNSKGLASSPLSKIISAEGIQIVKAKVNLEELANGHLLFIKNLTVPETRFIIMVTGLTAYIESNESSLGQKISPLKVEPALKEALSEQGVSFTNDISRADIMIKLKAKARKGAKVYSLFSAFADVTVSVTDMSSGNEVYKEAFNHIKGIQLDFEKAGLTALDKAGEKMKQIAPEIIKKALH